MTPLAYSVAEACQQLGGISRSSLYRLADKGLIRFAKVGSRSLVPHTQLVALIDAGIDEGATTTNPDHATLY